MDINKLKELQSKALKSILITAIVVAVITIIFALVTQIIEILVFGLMAGLFLCIFISASPRKEFRLMFKKVFVEKSLQSVFTDLDYRPDQGLNRYTIASTQMMDMGDRYSSNDFISAKYINPQVIEIEFQCLDKDSVKRR